MPEYKYDLTGNLTSETYPSGRVVETQYDATGHVAGVAALRLGNGLWERTDYNNSSSRNTYASARWSRSCRGRGDLETDLRI